MSYSAGALRKPVALTGRHAVAQANNLPPLSAFLLPSSCFLSVTDFYLYHHPLVSVKFARQIS